MTVILEKDKTKRQWDGQKVQKLTVKDRKKRKEWEELLDAMKELKICAFEETKCAEWGKPMVTLEDVKRQILLR